MNSLEILSLLSLIPHHTVGVFAADKIIERWHKPCAFIFTPDDSSKRSQHWVSVYVAKNSNAYYLDSYGLAPCIPNHVRVLRKNCRHVRWDIMQLQSDESKVCGQFCVMFLFCMSNGKTVNEFLNKFTTNTLQNDRIVEKFVEKISKTKSKRNTNKNRFVGGGLYNLRFIQKCLCKNGR